jgi:hypothetical protein
MPQLEYVPLQPWTCARCGAAGDVEIPEGAGALDTTLRLAAAHKAKSIQCAKKWGVGFLKLGKVAVLPAD